MWDVVGAGEEGENGTLGEHVEWLREFEIADVVGLEGASEEKGERGRRDPEEGWDVAKDEREGFLADLVELCLGYVVLLVSFRRVSEEPGVEQREPSLVTGPETPTWRKVRPSIRKQRSPEGLSSAREQPSKSILMLPFGGKRKKRVPACRSGMTLALTG